MLVGITYDLKDDYRALGYDEETIAEFDSEETIAGIENGLRAAGHQPARIGNLQALLPRLTAGERWPLVFNICEGLFGLGREAAVPALLDAFRIPYTFSDPMVLGLTLHKGMTKRVIRDAGLPTAAFAVVESPEDLVTVDLPYPLFAKPVAEGTGKGISAASKITDPQRLEEVCLDLLVRFHQPVLVETYLPGREFTVGLVGSGDDAQVIGGIEVVWGNQAEADIYSFLNKKEYRRRVHYEPMTGEAAAHCAAVALSAWRVLGCRDGGRIDLRLDAGGVPHFIEVNPLAGLHPIDSDLPIICRMSGWSHERLIAEIMASALKRLPR